MKRILSTSLIIVLVSALIYAPVYIYLIYTVSANQVDYTSVMQGKWNVYQYYHEKDRVACDDENWMTLEIDGEQLKIEGNVLPETECSFTWLNGNSISFDADGKNTIFYLSFDANNNLKINVAETTYVLMLRKAG